MDAGNNDTYASATGVSETLPCMPSTLHSCWCLPWRCMQSALLLCWGACMRHGDGVRTLMQSMGCRLKVGMPQEASRKGM